MKVKAELIIYKNDEKKQSEAHILPAYWTLWGGILLLHEEKFRIQGNSPEEVRNNAKAVLEERYQAFAEYFQDIEQDTVMDEIIETDVVYKEKHKLY